jgi:hypothetical protein
MIALLRANRAKLEAGLWFPALVMPSMCAVIVIPVLCFWTQILVPALAGTGVPQDPKLK